MRLVKRVDAFGGTALVEDVPPVAAIGPGEGGPVFAALLAEVDRADPHIRATGIGVAFDTGGAIAALGHGAAADDKACEALPSDIDIDIGLYGPGAATSACL